MNLKSLPSEEMIYLGQQWLTARFAPLFQHEVLRSWTNLIRQRLDPLVTMVTQQRNNNVSDQRWSEEVKQADRYHDLCYRTTQYALVAHLELARMNGETEREQMISMAMEELFPQGLGMLKWSYEAEAGWAERFAELADKHHTLLSQLIIHNATAMDLARQSVEAGRKLGQLLLNRPTSAPRDTATELTLRNGWIRTINAFFAVMDELPADFEPQLKQELLAMAEDRVTARQRSSNASAAEASNQPMTAASSATSSNPTA